MLPYEAEAAQAMSAEFTELFHTATDLNALAVTAIFPNGITGTQALGIDRRVVQVCAGLHVRALKEHRSTQILAERGLGQDALAISRCLFETTLAVAFLLRHRVTLTQQGPPTTAKNNPTPNKQQRIKLPKIKGKPLSTRFRTRLFLANTVFERERTAREFARTAGLKRFSKSQNKAALNADVATAEGLIGPEWSKRLRSQRSFSGLSIKDLAISLGLPAAYATHYRVGSWAVHPSMLTRYITFTPGDHPTLHLTPSNLDVAPAMGSANLFLLTCLSFMNRRFGLGLDADIAAMRPRVQQAP